MCDGRVVAKLAQAGRYARIAAYSKVGVLSPECACVFRPMVMMDSGRT